MQKTSNYNLNQWESTDPIRREDFNADNAAIDAALAKMAGAYSADNVPWETGILDLTGVAEGDVVKAFDFEPTAVFVGAVLYMTGFAINGGECRTRRHTTSDYYEFLLNGNTLQVNSLNGEPTTTVQYLALK